jgi:DNA-directed RNA polymerase subunit RPC12/RpoP
LTLKKWEEEKELRKQEIEAKASSEKEKVDTLKTIGLRLGKAVFQGALEGSQGGVGGKPAKSYTIEAGEGEAAEFSCPTCGSTVGLLADTAVATCAGCGSQFPVKRIPKTVPTEATETVPPEKASETSV